MRSGLVIDAHLRADGTRVDACVRVRPLSFGAAFGFGNGVRHGVTSSASTGAGVTGPVTAGRP